MNEERVIAVHPSPTPPEERVPQKDEPSDREIIVHILGRLAQSSTIAEMENALASALDSIRLTREKRARDR